MINIGKYPDLETKSVNDPDVLDYKDLKGTVVLNGIISLKHDIVEQNVLKNYRKKLLLDYIEYEKNKYSLQKIVPDDSLSYDAKELLKQTYDAEPKYLEVAKNRILELMPKKLYGKCPYCRMVPHTSFDHYFPKSVFPEYSVFPLNLIPCCAICNPDKGSKLFDSEGNRLFINFRFDIIPDYQFLYCILGWNNGVPLVKGFELRFHENEPTETLIRNHYIELDLLEKMKPEAEQRLAEITNQYSGKGDLIVMKNQLREKLEGLVKTNGINYCEASVYSAVLMNDQIMNNILHAKTV